MSLTTADVAARQTIPALASVPRLYTTTLSWKDGSKTPGGIASIVAAPSGARFAVMRPPPPNSLHSALEQVRMQRIGHPNEALMVSESWGYPGGGPIDEPLLDLSDDLLILPLDASEALDLSVSHGANAWLGKRVWVPTLDKYGHFRRAEGRVTARPFGAIVVDLDTPVAGALESSPVIAADAPTLVGIVSRSVKHGEVGDTLLVTPAGAVWQRVSANELRFPLRSVISAAGSELDRLWYGWRSRTQQTAQVRRVHEVGGRVTWARGTVTTVAEKTETGGLVLRAQGSALQEAEPGAERDARAAQWEPIRPLAVNVAGRLSDPGADARESWWAAGSTARSAERLAFVSTPAWQWRAHVELLAGLDLPAHGKVTLPAHRDVTSADELVHARLTHRTVCSPTSLGPGCARLVLYFRKRSGAPVQQGASADPPPSVGGWLTQPAPRGTLVREVLVTNASSLEPVSVTSEGFLRTGEGELDVVHTLREERYEPAPHGPVCEDAEQDAADELVRARSANDERPTQPPIPNPDNASPEYPVAARRARIESLTKVRLTISASGRVERVCIFSGHELFDESVVSALSTWRYEPARLGNGEPFTVRRVIYIPFMLLP